MSGMKTAEKTILVRLAGTSRKLPDNWRRVAGMLRGRRKLLEKHVNAVRGEWK
ncbi:MAG: hypothetical protein AAB798_00860 [Patescibacteria group bacterium]